MLNVAADSTEKESSWKVCKMKLNYGIIGHVLNEQGTGCEHIFDWYEYSVLI